MTITSAISAMGHTLGLTVVAEGVETQEHRTFLAAHGCDAIQGSLISPPVPAEVAVAFLGDGWNAALAPKKL